MDSDINKEPCIILISILLSLKNFSYYLNDKLFIYLFLNKRGCCYDKQEVNGSVFPPLKCDINRHEVAEPATLLKKRLWHRCFPVNFVKFLRIAFLQITSGRLLLLKMI